jgi:Zn finger protein HypA/HybF involved in hydrogenase expression
MMQVRCQKCGWNFTLSRDAIANIMEEVNETKAKNYTMECPKCRHAIKVQTRRLARFYRPPAPETADQGSQSDV